MKKSLLLLASLSMSAASFAQWTEPTAPAKDARGMVDDGVTEQYLYNEGAKGFFLGANDWETRASVSTSHGVKVKMTQAGAGKWSLIDYVEKFKEYRKTFADNPQAIWVDNNNGANCDAWVVTALNDGIYTIYNAGIGEYNLGVAEYYEGKTGNTRLWLYDSELTYQNPDNEEEELLPIFTGEFWDKWYFVSEEDYKAWEDYAAAYASAGALKAAIDDAKASYEGIDLSAAEAFYNNTASTAAELDSAKNSIVPNTIKAYVNDKMVAEASVANPYDATAYIVNPSFETGNTTGWTVQSSSDTGAKENSNGTYHCANADGNYLFNIWDWGYPISQNIVGLPNGIYEVSAMVSSSDDCTNIYLTTETKLGKYHKAVTLETNPEDGRKQTWLTEGSMLVAVTDGNLTIGAVGCDPDGVSYIENGKWWYKADNFKLSYLGNSADAWKHFQQNGDLEFPTFEEGTIAMTQLVNDYNQAQADFYAKTDPEEIAYALEGITVLSDSINKNIEAYKNIVNSVQKVEDDLSKSDIEGIILVFSDLMNAEDVDMSTEALEGIKEDIVTTPGSDDQTIAKVDSLVDVLKYGPKIILATEGEDGFVEGVSLSYTTEQAQAYANALVELYQICTSLSLEEGDDFTNVIINPAFTDANGKGWNQAFKAGNLAWTGGISTFPVAESYHSTFDIYQEVKAPDGIYSVSLNGFCRLDDGVDATVPAEVYLNDFASPLMTITDGKLPLDQAVDGFNCYLTNGASGAWTSNPIFNNEDGTPVSHKSPNDATDSSDEEGYWPNGMEGASVAFSSGRYEAKVYGIVEGGKMRLGVRNLKSTHVWALWSNFKLTYEGMNKEAVDAIAENYIATAEAVAENTSAPVAQSIIDIINEINKSEGDPEAKYAAVIKLNAAVKDAQENIDALAAFTAAKDALGTAAEEYAETASAQAMAMYDELANLQGIDMTTEELKSNLDKVNYCLAAIKVPAYEDASDENPIDFTQVITNPDFEANGATQQPTGWTVVKLEGASGNYQTQTGFNNIGMEFWSNSNGSATKYNFYQKIIALPAGTYKLNVDASNSYNGQEAGPGTGAAYIYAATGTGEELAYTQVAIDPQVAGCKDLFNNYEIAFNVAEGEEVYVGSKTEGDLSARWVMVDNFTLTYLGTNSTAVEIKNTEATSKATIAAIYNAAGQKTDKVRKGINIVKMSDGSTKKLYVK